MSTPTPEDYESVNRAGEELQRRGWRRAFSLNEVVDMWAYLVASVERGYTMTIDDYTNDLSIRRWAEEARPLLTPLVAGSMDERLAPLDERFREATVATTATLPGAGTDYWWCRRVPKVLVDELAEDVERMGLLRNEDGSA
jgi:hypothetical protein